MNADTMSVSLADRRAILLVMIAAALAVPASAATIILTMDPNIANYHSYTYVDGNGNTVQEYTGPYRATLSGGSYGTGAIVYVNCFDINVHVSAGGSYSGLMTLPVTFADLQVAYLEKKMRDAGGYTAPVSVTGPLAMAIWQLENPSSVNTKPFPLDPAAAPLIADALLAVTSGAWTAADASYYPIWFPTPLGSAQRFGLVLGREPLPTDLVPEPEALVLAGAGLVLIGLIRRRR